MQVYELFSTRWPAPEWLDRSLTVGGLVSHGRRFEREWQAVIANADASRKLLVHVLDGPEEPEKRAIIHAMATALSQR